MHGRWGGAPFHGRDLFGRTVRGGASGLGRIFNTMQCKLLVFLPPPSLLVLLRSLLKLLWQLVASGFALALLLR